MKQNTRNAMVDEEVNPAVTALCGDESGAIQGLWDWVGDMGGSSPKVKLSEAKSRTIVTAASIQGTTQEGETIFSIPISCLMHPAVALKDKQYGTALTALSTEVGLDDRTILVFFLAIERERNASSKWAPYINSLPAEFPTPLNWSAAELRHLAGTRLEGAVKKQREELQKQIEEWVPMLLGRLQMQLSLLETSDVLAFEKTAAANAIALAERALTPERVAWSRSCVWSRAFSLFIDGTKTVALVPLGDMLDHSSGTRVEWRTDDAAKTFSIISHQPISEGSVVYNNYGDKSNEELLLGYGFVLEPNSADSFHVMLAAGSMSDKCSAHDVQDERSEPAVREDLLHRCGLESNFYLRLDDPLPNALLAAARIYLMSPAAAYMCNSNIGSLWDVHNAMDASSDIHSSFRVLQVLTRLLTTDFDRLRSGSDLVAESSSRGGSVRRWVARMATVYRKSQMKIVAAALEELRKRSQHLLAKLEHAEQERLAAKSENGCLARVRNQAIAPADFELAYHAWEAELGVHKVAAEELSMFAGTNVLGGGVGGLRVISTVVEGGVLGSAPAETLLLADDAILHESTHTMADSGEQVALAATLLLYAEHCNSRGFGPFARWLLSAPTTMAAFDKDVLQLLENTPVGQEALSTRQEYDDEFTALSRTASLRDWRNLQNLRDTYAKARVVVERHAFRLPCWRGNLQPRGAGQLALAPFVGSLPRSLDDVAGTFCWAHRSGIDDNVYSEWRLELKAVCQLKTGSLLITPLDGIDEETRLLEIGSGAASSPPLSPRLLMQDDGRTKFPSHGITSLPTFHHGENTLNSTIPNRWHAVEILLGAADEDRELQRRKRNLLFHLGLGEAHYLTLPPSPARLCLALAILGAESHANLEMVCDELLETAAASSAATSTSVARSGAEGQTDRICMPKREENGSSISSLSLATTHQLDDDHLTSSFEPRKEGLLAKSANSTLIIMTSNIGVCKRARKAARTLLRRILGLLPKGLDTDSLWRHARDEVERGNQQRAGAFVYLAHRRSIIESWLKALTSIVDPLSADGKKRKREPSNASSR